MKKIRVYATSANLGPGFDTLGICLNLYNEYAFENSSKYELVGFDERYSDETNNLIISAYERTCIGYHKESPLIYLEQITSNIPTSRGLGSSAACIVAGIMIANDIANLNLSKEEMLTLATEFEGHPDNAAPLIYGGLVISCIDGGEIITKKIKVSDNLIFTLAIPSFEFKTETARAVLPKAVTLRDAVYNISHAMLLIKALEEGDIQFLKKAINDKLHVIYRIDYIRGARELLKNIRKKNICGTISGAGSAMILISNESHLEYLRNILDNDWDLKELKCQEEGAYIYE